MQLFWLLPLLLSWTLTVSGLRQLQVVILHHCAHGTLFKQDKFNRLLGETISIILWLKNFSAYRIDHVKVHHGQGLMTEKDETTKFLYFVEFRPSMTSKEAWIRLIFSLISPWFHLRFLAARIKSCFFSSDFRHNAIAWLFHGTILTLVILTNTWLPYLIIWFFPLTVLYQVSNTIRICLEHCWPEPEFIDVRNKLILGRLTVGIFLGEMTPDSSLYLPKKTLKWFIWTIKMTYHLFCRIFILVGDLPVHDWHHRYPASRDWPNYIFARQQDLEKGCPGWPEPYQEVWGLHNALTLSFESLSKLPKQDNESINVSITSVYSNF